MQNTNQPSTINDQPSPRSGDDLDIWGGRNTTPVLIPGPGTVCVLQDEEGCCPMGCDACEEFARQMEDLTTEAQPQMNADGRRWEIINQKS